ncbi:MAG: hypothetical protein AN484_27135, partial [Aphanizomenon flos-aquae WA102]
DYTDQKTVLPSLQGSIGASTGHKLMPSTANHLNSVPIKQPRNNIVGNLDSITLDTKPDELFATATLSSYVEGLEKNPSEGF